MAPRANNNLIRNIPQNNFAQLYYEHGRHLCAHVPNITAQSYNQSGTYVRTHAGRHDDRKLPYTNKIVRLPFGTLSYGSGKNVINVIN